MVEHCSFRFYNSWHAKLEELAWKNDALSSERDLRGYQKMMKHEFFHKIWWIPDVKFKGTHITLHRHKSAVNHRNRVFAHPRTAVKKARKLETHHDEDGELEEEEAMETGRLSPILLESDDVIKPCNQDSVQESMQISFFWVGLLSVRQRDHCSTSHLHRAIIVART